MYLLLGEVLNTTLLIFYVGTVTKRSNGNGETGVTATILNINTLLIFIGTVTKGQ